MSRRRLIRIAGPTLAALLVEVLFMMRTIADKGLWDSWTYSYEKVISGYLEWVFPLTILVVVSVEAIQIITDEWWSKRGWALEIATYAISYAAGGFLVAGSIGLIDTLVRTFYLGAVCVVFGLLHWSVQTSVSRVLGARPVVA
ncbi:hypothetical protein [Brevundimonas sp.]|uniref:hypothetical protein n=1 Tax=Brevundimonas sp. TaxID=1871086 RepID=UPI003AF7C986